VQVLQVLVALQGGCDAGVAAIGVAVAGILRTTKHLQALKLQ
jgi:hypothetical protein